jgi:hypothetical protein
MKIASLVAFFATMASSALAHELPRFNVETHCKQVAGFGGSYSATIDKSCFDMEQDAYDKLKQIWPSVAAKTQKHCATVAGFGGSDSYSILQSCVQMETSAASGNEGRKFKY